MKQEEKSALSKTKILNAAMAEFSQKGYEGASLNTVWAREGISKGIIYHHFKDKDELYLLCVKACFDAKLQFFSLHPEYLGIFVDASFNPPTKLLPQIIRLRQGFDALNISVLTRLLKAEPLRPGLSVELVAAFLTGKLITRLRMPSILGWLITGMLLGPNALGLMPQQIMDSQWYKLIITWMQCAFGLMLGTELIWKKIKAYGKALMVTTLIQSLGTFAIVSLLFAILFWFTVLPLYLAFAFGGIALATAPAPALSIVQEFHTQGPVTDTLLPMAVLDDIVGIAVFFTVNSFITRLFQGDPLRCI